MVYERKVMNNMDRNFNVRIEVLGIGGRIIFDKGEGGVIFRRLNNVLKRYVNLVLVYKVYK